MTYRERLSATVRADLLDAGRRAVAEGRAPSLSAWVDEALARQADNDRRLKALDRFVSEYEAEHGEITKTEIEAARRWARARAVRVGPDTAPRRPARSARRTSR